MYLSCITITQFTIITSLIGFNIGLTNVTARLKQRYINVVPTLCNVVLTLCNVVLTLFQSRALTLYQRRTTLKIRCRILFHFQRRIKVVSTMIHNVAKTLIRRWNVGWVINCLNSKRSNFFITTYFFTSTVFTFFTLTYCTDIIQAVKILLFTLEISFLLFFHNLLFQDMLIKLAEKEFPQHILLNI